ncbi:ArdC family protein [Sphingosinicella terrae]|uniref:ArdC family protein n=1 Tax=Sphingosinicella terrae TaxID=2172047 RepID=UPI000E0D953E|nr:zincin-like metallopeptidase domain-containing protein [Sphingosinicella terrae]
MKPMRIERQSLYSEVTGRIIAELEEGRVPWVQPWDSAACGCTMPVNAVTGRGYSGINVLILWAAGVEGGCRSQRWLTYRQAQLAGGHVAKGEKGTVVCYADRFTPKNEEERAATEDREARQIAFLKRFTLFNIDQCEGLPEKLTELPAPKGEREAIPEAEALIAATGADFRVGGDIAFYAPGGDYVQVPPPEAYFEAINWYRTALHELGHWTGHPGRLGRDQSAGFGTPDYAREELVAEMASAFVCATLSIRPTVRHADYVGAWLDVLREDERAIFRAASLASKAAEFLLAFVHEPGRDEPGRARDDDSDPPCRGSSGVPSLAVPLPLTPQL